MKIFDLHTDILYDLYIQKEKGVEGRFASYHREQLKSSPVVGGIWTLYSPDDFDLKTAVATALSELPAPAFSEFEIVLGFEGLRNLPAAPEIEYFYRLGFRHASLTWNEENRYATGVKGDPDRGLTAEGKRLLDKMDELGMIVDLAHLNEKSFYDVIARGPRNVIFSHGNLKAVCDHRRNLTDEQVKALKNAGGLLGLTLAGNFVSRKREEQTLEYFLNHLDHAVKLIGVDNVAFGFDFMDYFTEEFPESNLRDVVDVTRAGLIVEGMRRRGYGEEEIAKICYKNFYNRYQDKIIRRKEDD